MQQHSAGIISTSNVYMSPVIFTHHLHISCFSVFITGENNQTVLCYFYTVSFYIPVSQVATSQTVCVWGEDGGGRGLPTNKPDPHRGRNPPPQLSNPRKHPACNIKKN